MIEREIYIPAIGSYYPLQRWQDVISRLRFPLRVRVVEELSPYSGPCPMPQDWSRWVVV